MVKVVSKWEDTFKCQNGCKESMFPKHYHNPCVDGCPPHPTLFTCLECDDEIWLVEKDDA